MTMTKEELLDILEDVADDAEIRFASQPSWPFEYSVDASYVTQENGNEVVYLAEGHQIGYLPGEVSSELGWR